MSHTDQHAIIEEWIAASNMHEADRYLSFFSDDAVLEDPGVGRTFRGLREIAEYYDAYFIGYNTHTELVSVTARDDYLHVEVVFTGDFPGVQTGGIFDIVFTGTKLSNVKADLI